MIFFEDNLAYTQNKCKILINISSLDRVQTYAFVRVKLHKWSASSLADADGRWLNNPSIAVRKPTLILGRRLILPRAR